MRRLGSSHRTRILRPQEAPTWGSSSLTRTTSTRTDDLVRHVRNCSSRHGAFPRLIVLHSTEGANLKGIVDLKGLGDWFDNPAAQASSHVATDAEGNSARFVDDSVKAWSCEFYNSMSLNIEQVGRAAQTSWPDAQIQETAQMDRPLGGPVRHPDPAGARQPRRPDHRAGRRAALRPREPRRRSSRLRSTDYPFDEVLRIGRGYLHLRQA
jgi:hypothetical protein